MAFYSFYDLLSSWHSTPIILNDSVTMEILSDFLYLAEIRQAVFYLLKVGTCIFSIKGTF